MRMWMINPELLCRSHLLGEHSEIHRALGNLQHTGTWAKNLSQKGYLEPQNFKERHNLLVKEMLRRGYKHNSPLEYNGVKLPYGKVDPERSILDLLDRCENCKNRIMEESV